MTALEMQFAAFSFAKKALDSHHPDLIRHRESLKFSRQLLYLAEPFFWAQETLHAAWSAAETVPMNVTPPTMPSRVSWWWLDGPLADHKAVTIQDDRGKPVPVRAILVSDGASVDLDGSSTPALSIVTFGLMAGMEDAPFPLHHWIWRRSETLNDLLTRPSNTGTKGRLGLAKEQVLHQAYVSRFLAASCVWLNSRIITLSAGSVERHRRKQLAREYDAHVTDVKIVQLRRAESQPRIDQGDGEPVEWSCRWIVNGHWRNQFYPSTGKHELKYILPYVKGPADKPLKVPTSTVYVVNR